MNAISFCVYGTREVYLRGMVENLRRMPRIYPGWQPLVFTDGAAGKEWVDLCQKLGASVHLREPREDAGGMFWRFEPVAGQEYEIVIVRDADSVISEREAAAVSSWLESDAMVHTMHDSHWHWDGPWPMLGGMWGARRGAFPFDLAHLLKWWLANRAPLGYDADQWFLKRYLWPHAMRSLMHHTGEPATRWRGALFPQHKPVQQHVGERVGEDALPDWRRIEMQRFFGPVFVLVG